jgi:FKBP-type peptidyl-prolyl cis-trans isomerase 2
MNIIHNGSKVAFNYTLTVEGKLVDTTEGRKALEYTQGDNTLISGLTKQLEGLKPGDEKNIEVKPEEGYGPVDPAAFQEIPLSAVPAGIEPAVGMTLQGHNPSGDTLRARISEVKTGSIKIDLNHPLAGKTLSFKVKILTVK